MNQKDYKGIAGIIKKYKFKLDMEYYLCMVNDLANYFEREAGIKGIGDKVPYSDFNRQQFLKDCGIND